MFLSNFENIDNSILERSTSYSVEFLNDDLFTEKRVFTIYILKLRWSIAKSFTPVLILSMFLILTGVIDFEQAFYVGLTGFAITAVVWWWWAIFTIRYLITTLNRASNNLIEVNTEVAIITKELQELKDEE